jgi:hypothetical protein
MTIESALRSSELRQRIEFVKQAANQAAFNFLNDVKEAEEELKRRKEFNKEDFSSQDFWGFLPITTDSG